MRSLCICFLIATVVGFALPVSAPQPFTLKTTGKDMPALSRPRGGDTLLFDDFEYGGPGWTLQDLTVQDTFWHIDTITPLGGSGYSFWCGTYSKPGWANPNYGYGDEWAQFLISPSIALTGISGDSVLLRLWHKPSCEYASGGQPGDTIWDGWDCLTAWVSTDDGIAWQPLFPDTIRFPGWNYNMMSSWAWYWNMLSGEFDSIPGWGLGQMFDWYEIGFDLTPYKDSTIRIRFSGVSDPAESDSSGSGNYYGMWFLDAIGIYDNLYNTYFFEDCESGMGNWIAKPRDPNGTFWHLTEYNAYSGMHSFFAGDSLTHYLPQFGSHCALVSPAIDLTKISSSDSCVADFFVDFEYNDPYGDFGQGYMIEVSSDDGATWTNIYAPYAGNYYFTGSTYHSWVSHNDTWGSLGLPPMQLNYWCGNIVKIRILSFNRGLDSAGYGMYVDDFIVRGSYIQFPKPQQVLIFDDDLNAVDVFGYPWNLYYESAVTNIGYHYLTINDIDQGIPDSIYMRKNGMVIWNLGPNGKQYDPSDPLSQNAVTQIQAYLRMGGKILLVGQDYLFDNFPNDFADSVLQIVSYNEAVGCDTIMGIAGDSIGDGLTYPLDFENLNGNGYGWDFIDDFTTSATPVFNTNRTGQPIMLRNSADGRLVFSTFPIEAVKYAPMRDTLMARIIKWLDPYQPAPLLTELTSLFTGVRVTWLKNPPYDLDSYRVYRSSAEAGPYTLLASIPPSESTFVDTTAVPDSTYFYGATALDNSLQESGMSNILSIVYTGVLENTSADISGMLYLQVNPNPFSKNLTIKYQIPNAKYQANSKFQTSIKIYDITGRIVKSYNLATRYSLPATVVWDGTDDLNRRVPAGIYFAELKYDNRRLTEKVILVY